MAAKRQSHYRHRERGAVLVRRAVHESVRGGDCPVMGQAMRDSPARVDRGRAGIELQRTELGVFGHQRHGLLARNAIADGDAEVHRGRFIEPQLLLHPQGRPLWIESRVERPLAADAASAPVPCSR